MIRLHPGVLSVVILAILNGIPIGKTYSITSAYRGVIGNDNSCLWLRLRSCLSVLYLQSILVFQFRFSFIIQFRIKSICHTSLSFRMKYYLVMRV